MRIEIKIPDNDPLAAVLSAFPSRHRARMIRLILSAALLPGGWAKLAAHPVAGRLVEAIEAEAAHPVETPPVTDDAPLIGGMSPSGARGFLAGLRQFGAFLHFHGCGHLPFKNR